MGEHDRQRRDDGWEGDESMTTRPSTRAQRAIIVDNVRPHKSYEPTIVTKLGRDEAPIL